MDIEFDRPLFIESAKLKISGSQKRKLYSYIRQIAGRINDEIIEAKRSDLTKLHTKMPSIYSIEGLSNKICQTTIWSKLIEELEIQGFEVQLEPDRNECKMHISWLTEQESRKVKKMLNIIASHTKSF